MGNIIVIAVLVLIIGGIVYKFIKDKKSGKGGCSGSCASCGRSCCK